MLEIVDVLKMTKQEDKEQEPETDVRSRVGQTLLWETYMWCETIFPPTYYELFRAP